MSTIPDGGGARENISALRISQKIIDLVFGSVWELGLKTCPGGIDGRDQEHDGCPCKKFAPPPRDESQQKS